MLTLQCYLEALVICPLSSPEDGSQLQPQMLLLAIPDIAGLNSRWVGDQLGGNDHLPIILTDRSVNLNKGLAMAR